MISPRRRLASALAATLVAGALISTSGISSASAATAKVGGPCKSEGAKATISAKSYVCANISLTKTKKLIWRLAPSLGAAGGLGGGANSGAPGGAAGAKGFGPGDGDGPDMNSAVAKKAFAAYNACLKKNGGVAERPPAKGVRPNARPSHSPSQIKAESKCSSLRPAGGPRPGGDDFGGNHNEANEGADD